MPAYRPEEDRFFEKVAFVDKWYVRDGVRTPCLEWTRARYPSGYGQFGLSRSRKTIGTHVWLYKRWFGPIP